MRGELEKGAFRQCGHHSINTGNANTSDSLVRAEAPAVVRDQGHSSRAGCMLDAMALSPKFGGSCHSSPTPSWRWSPTGSQVISPRRALAELDRIRLVTVEVNGRTIRVVTKRNTLQAKILAAFGVNTASWDKADID